MAKWPQDTQAARNTFYGDPERNEIGAQMVPVVPPFAMYYDGKRVSKIMFHKKAAHALLAALNEIWDFCQHDQKKIDAAGVSKYAGAYNHRLVRGSKTKWSNHAYAAAIDLNAGENALGVSKGTMPQFVVDAFCRQGAMWGGWYKSRPDWMHFEFVDNGGRAPKSQRPVWPIVPHLLDASHAEPPADELDDENSWASAERDEPSVGAHQNVQAQTAAHNLSVEVLQKQLLGLKYFELGDADGLWGGRTRGAVTAFLNDRGKSPDGLMTDAGWATAAAGAAISSEVSRAVSENWPRPVAKARATITEQELAPTAPAVQQSLWQRFWAKITGWSAVILAAFKGASDYFDGLREKVQPVMTFFSDVPTWLWFAGIGGAALLLYLSANKATNSIVDAKRTGKLN